MDIIDQKLSKDIVGIVRKCLPVYVVFKTRQLFGSKERDYYFGVYDNFSLAEKDVMKDINDHYKKFKYHKFSKRYQMKEIHYEPSEKHSEFSYQKDLDYIYETNIITIFETEINFEYKAKYVYEIREHKMNTCVPPG